MGVVLGCSTEVCRLRGFVFVRWDRRFLRENGTSLANEEGRSIDWVTTRFNTAYFPTPRRL